REHGLAFARRDARVDLHPLRARLEDDKRRDLLQEHGRRLLAGVVVADGGEDDRQPRPPEGIEEPGDRRHDLVEVADERRGRVGEAAVDVDDDERRSLAEPRPSVEALEAHDETLPDEIEDTTAIRVRKLLADGG